MILITGFEPFGKSKINLSKEIILKLDQIIPENIVQTLVLPVNWNSSLSLYIDKLLKLTKNPKLTLLLGINDSKIINFEKFAYNWILGVDNDLRFKIGPIQINNSFLLYTSLPIDRLIQKVRSFHPNLKIKTSIFPGTYLCNFLYYWALSLSKRHEKVLFIHLPYNGNLYDLLIVTIQILKFFDPYISKNLNNEVLNRFR